MDEHNSQKDKYFSRAAGLGISLFRSLKLQWEWRQLRWALAAASDAAQGHEANGLRPGSLEFQTLYSDVARKAQEYCTRSNEQFASVKAKLPALCAMEKLAHPDLAAHQNKVLLVLVLLIATVFGCVGVGALIGFATGIAHWISHLIG